MNYINLRKKLHDFVDEYVDEAEDAEDENLEFDLVERLKDIVIFGELKINEERRI